MALRIRDNDVSNIFQLYGDDENSGTFAIGWTLENSSEFLKEFLAEINCNEVDLTYFEISMQKHGRDGGFTDIEIKIGSSFHAIIEAKRWWDVPQEPQLRRYVPRLLEHRALHQLLISVSSSNKEHAMRKLPSIIEGIKVIHISWNDFQRLGRRALKNSKKIEDRIWLKQLDEHLKGYISMSRINDNKVYVVALSKDNISDAANYTWIDVVEKDQRYFHPVGGSYPVQPPNYIGFRYNGRVQSVHHIESFQIVDDLTAINPNWPKIDQDHFVYCLGPAMRPPIEMKIGNKIVLANRVTCAIDTLLSGEFKTLSDAFSASKKREENSFS